MAKTTKPIKIRVTHTTKTLKVPYTVGPVTTKVIKAPYTVLPKRRAQ